MHEAKRGRCNHVPNNTVHGCVYYERWSLPNVYVWGLMSNQEPEHLHWFTHKQQGVDTRSTVPRKYPNYNELLAQAEINQAYRKANPDPDRCSFCFGNDYRTVTARYSTLACHWPRKGRKKKDRGYVYAHVLRDHRVCNRCHPLTPPSFSS